MKKVNKIIGKATFREKTSYTMNAILVHKDEKKFLKYEEEGSQTNVIEGRITISRSIYKEGVPNATVTVFKDNVIYDYIDTHSGITEDEDIDEILTGTYYLALEPGVYDVKIESDAIKRNIKNYIVTDGISEYRKVFKEGQIKAKYPVNNPIKNVVEFESFEDNNSQNRYVMVVGTILDQHRKPANNAELIIINTSTKEVDVFIKTKEDGKYSFILDIGEYDIILRSPNHNAKIIRGYDFTNYKEGFLINNFKEEYQSETNRYNNNFNHGGGWLWISN